MTFIAQLSQDNGNITLKKFDGASFPKFNPGHSGLDILKVCFLDLESKERAGILITYHVIIIIMFSIRSNFNILPHFIF